MQDKAFFASLKRSRSFQGVVFVVIASLFVFVWLRTSMRLWAPMLAVGSLGLSLLVAFIGFHFLP